MSEIQAQIDALKDQISTLQAQNKALVDKENWRTKKKYDEVTSEIQKVVSNGDVLQLSLENIMRKVDSEKLLVKLGEANNPQSDILGFQFTKIINAAVQKQFKKELDQLPTNERNRFQKFIDKVVQRPVISAILNSNPVTSIVSSIIHRVSSLITIGKGGEGKKIKDLVVEAKNVFDEEKIDAFCEELKPFIEFYDMLLSASQKYDYAVTDLTTKYENLYHDSKNYYFDFLATLGIDISSGDELIKQANAILLPENEDYASILEKKAVIAAHELAQKYPVLKREVEQFESDYTSIIRSYLNAHLNAFDFAKKFPVEAFDLNKLVSLENTIKEQLDKI